MDEANMRTTIETYQKGAQLRCAQASLRAHHLRQQAAAYIAQAEQAEREAYGAEGQSEACQALLKTEEAG